MTTGRKNQNVKMGDSTINSVLDGLLTVSEIDPTWIQPDHHLLHDLALTSEDILKVGRWVSQKLNLRLSDQDEATLPLLKTPRELVRHFETLLEKNLHNKAG